jgi:Tfp pilus assembly protein PilO
MDIRIKLLLVAFPFIVALYVGISMLQPAMDEAKTKEAAATEKETENESYKTKLAGSSKISQRQVELRQQIEQLRGSVPKEPDNDLLLIDVEKMCKDAGMSLISFTAPKEVNGGPAKSVEDAAKKKQDKLKNMLKGGAAPESNAPDTSSASSGGELEHLSKSIIVSGDYQSLQKLVHELETYQRVVKIDDLSFHLPRKDSAKGSIKIDESAPGEGEDAGDPRLMFITMTITSYYLP